MLEQHREQHLRYYLENSPAENSVSVKQSMSRYMTTKLSKSHMHVIDRNESSDCNAAIPVTQPRISSSMLSRALFDDASSTRTGITSSETGTCVQTRRPSCEHIQENREYVRPSSERDEGGRREREEEDGASTENPLDEASCTMTSSASSELCLPLPYSKIPKAKTLYGRVTEMETLQRNLELGGTITCLSGIGGMGKTHLAAHACKKWLAQRPFSRFVVWINAATEWTLRISYLEALEQILMGNVQQPANSSVASAHQGEIIIVAELLHRQLSRQRRKEQAQEQLRKRRGQADIRNEDEETTNVLSDDSEDGAKVNNDDDSDADDDDSAGLQQYEQETMDTKVLAQLLWDALLQGISQDYEWIVVFQNLPGGMAGVQGPDGLQPYFLPTGNTPEDDWLQGRILCTTRHHYYSGKTSLGYITALRLDRLDEAAAIRMLVAQAVFDANHEVGRKNLESHRKQEILQEAERIAQKLVGPHYLDGSPLMISTAVGQIISSRMTIREYYVNLKHQVAVALETSGYGNGKVQTTVKRETAMAVCLEQAMDNVHAHELVDILAAAAFLSAESIPLKLLGGDAERVQKLCEMNLLSHVGKEIYSMHRIHQRTAVDAIITNLGKSSDLSDVGDESEDFLCTPDHAVLALRAFMSSFQAEDATTWRSARSCVPHVEAMRVHHDLLERKRQQSSTFNHAYYAEIISHTAAVIQWALKDRSAALAMFQEALRLQRILYIFVPTSDSLSISSSSNMKSDLAAALTKTLTSLGGLAEKDQDAQKYYREALDIFCQTFGEDSKSIELMTLYIALADVEVKLQHQRIAYDLYKKALELYFQIYGHNQNIYADDQKMFLAETLQKIGGLAHHQMERHTEAELYLEGTVSLLRHVFDDGSVKKRDELANALETLGSICHAQNRMNDARQYYMSALKMKTKIHGDKGFTYSSLSKDSVGDVNCTESHEHSSFNDSDSEEGGHTVGEDQSFLAQTLHNSNQEYAVELVPVDSETRNKAIASSDVKLARTLHRLGVMAWNLGSLKQAEDYFQKALSMQYSGYGMDAMNEDIAITLFSLGGLANDLHSNQEKACAYYKKALNCYYSTYGEDTKNESIAQLLHALGQSSQVLKRHHDAKLYLKKALEMKYVLYGGFDGVNPDLVSTLLDLGKVSRDLNEHKEAIFYFKAALKGLYVIHGKEAKNVQIAAALTQLGGLSYCFGILDDAKNYFEKCLDMKLHLYGKDAVNDDLASTLNNLGSLNARLKNHEAAFKYYEQALEQYNMIGKQGGKASDNEDVKSHQARTLHNLGLLSYNLKQYQEAKKFYAGALRIKSEVFKDVNDSPDLAVTLSKLSSVEAKQGKYDSAKYYQDQAIKRSPTFLETHKKLINKNLLPTTLEEAVALVAIVPAEERMAIAQNLKSMGFWEGQDTPKDTKSCWYPFKGRNKKKSTKKFRLPTGKFGRTDIS